MRCVKARRLISDGLDEPLRPDRAGALAGHLEGCPECRAFARDLGLIVDQAGKLPPVEPPAGAWRKIAAGVRAAGAMSPAGETASGPRPGRWRYALAAASLLGVVGAGIVIGLRYRRATSTADSPGRGTPAYTLAKIREAQDHYEKALAALGEAARGGPGGLEPVLADAFAQNLAGLDRTIEVCRRMVEENPEDLVFRAHLLAAYREKVSLVETIVGFGRAPDRKMKTTTL